MAGALLFSCNASADIKGDILTEVQSIAEDTGVCVHHEYNAETFFPADWRDDELAARGQQVPSSEIKRVLPLIRRFLAAYPQDVLRMELTDIYLVSDLNIYGKSFGGTSSENAIYINCSEDADNDFLLARLHSEFSSILMRNHSFPKDEWQKQNPTAFQYLGSGVKMLDGDDLYGQSRRLLTNGFLVKYSQSSVENDFNMISDWIFTKRHKLETLCAKYPVLRKKCDLAVEFYKSVGCDFDINVAEPTREVRVASASPLSFLSRLFAD